MGFFLNIQRFKPFNRMCRLYSGFHFLLAH